MNYTEIKFTENYGILQFDLPIPLFEKVRKKIGVIQKTQLDDPKFFHNKKLIGHIEKEIRFHPDMEFRSYINLLGKTYSEYFNYLVSQEKVLESCWINFQKKYEYNPVHAHSGILSFVIWIKIPYKLEDEDKMPNSVNANSQENGRFCLFYNTNFSSISNIRLNLDSTYEGKGIIFPAAAKHCVHPFFTSDDYRISIAGNITTKPT